MTKEYEKYFSMAKTIKDLIKDIKEILEWNKIVIS